MGVQSSDKWTGPSRAEQERRDLDVPDCKRDQNAITTCFERLFMSCL